MSDKDKGVIILAPASDYGTPGSVRVMADCGHECWIGEAMLQFQLSGTVDTRTSCYPCEGITAQKLIEMGKTGVVKAPPGVREEVEKNLGKQMTDKVFKDFNVKEEF